jgi:hypothetical protein
VSLQNDGVRNRFVTACADIWRSWLLDGSAAVREEKLEAAIVSMSSFMVAPDVKFATLGGWGAFSWTGWKLKVNKKYTGKDDIRYKDFVEVCCTIYHETRHAEQFYRIAQGLAAGKLKFPDASSASTVQKMAAGVGSVKSRIAMFEAVGKGTDPLQLDTGKRIAVISERLKLPLAVVRHADINRDGFQTFIDGARPAWFKRSTVLDEVNEWMRATYKKTFSELDTWAQGNDGPYRIYRDLPEENDAHGIEAWVESGLYQRIGHVVWFKKRRDQTAIFGP